MGANAQISRSTLTPTPRDLALTSGDWTRSEQIIDAFLGMFRERAWETTRPDIFTFGPINPLVTQTALGVSPGALSDELKMSTECSETFVVTVVTGLTPVGSEDTVRKLLRMRSEIRKMTEANPRLGLEFVLDTVFDGASLSATERQNGQWEAVASISFRVRYYD